MSEKLLTRGELRSAVQKLGAQLLEDSSSDGPVPLRGVQDFLTSEGKLPPLWEQKGNRYGYGNAISGLMRAHAIDGRGREAKFKAVPDVIKGRMPKTRMQNAVREILAITARHFNSTEGPHTEIMEQYSALGANLPPAEGTIRLGHGVLGGGDYRHVICQYSFVTGNLMKDDPELASTAAESKRDVAHGALVLAIGREASMHGLDFVAADSVLELHDEGEVSLRSARNGHILDFGDHRRAAALHQGVSYDTPPLACPAHQLRAGEPETDLQTFVHAGVNLAYDLSVFAS